MQLKDCNPGEPKQRWDFVDVGRGGRTSSGRVFGKGGLCLQYAMIPSSAPQNGSRAFTGSCDGSVKNMTVGADGSLRFWSDESGVAAVSNSCLSVEGGIGQLTGSNVWVWECNGRPWQEWVQNSDGSLYNVWSGKCLTSNALWVDPGPGQNTLTIENCQGGRSQEWSLPTEAEL